MRTNSQLISAVFLDRDGVIIEDRADFVKSWDEVKFIPAAFGAIRRLTEAGLPVVIVTNQSAVGRNIITHEFVENVHERMLLELELQGARIARAYFCPHHPDAGCDCRKPAPGMLLRAASDLGLNLASCVMVGDSLRDIEAANSAGVRAILVRTGKGAREASLLSRSGSSCQCLAVVDDIGAAADLILAMVHV